MVPSFTSTARSAASPRRRVLISPAFARLDPPTIVIGMHRSGTSVVSGMMSILGVYMDPDWPAADGRNRVVAPGPLMRRNGYGEAHAFRLLNERLMFWADSDWDHPSQFLAHRDLPRFSRRAVLALQSATFSSLRHRFLDGAERNGPAAWGWKDPRTSLTLPLWLQLFPEARVLHVRRNFEHIADSLLKRAAAQSASQGMPSFASRLSGIVKDPVRLIKAARRRFANEEPAKAREPFNRDYCVKLAETYVEECKRYRCLGARYMEVHYEDILQAPRTFASQIAEFSGVNPDADILERASAFVTQDNVRPIGLPNYGEPDSTAKPSEKQRMTAPTS